jgi:hypothetical protein
MPSTTSESPPSGVDGWMNMRGRRKDEYTRMTDG